MPAPGGCSPCGTLLPETPPPGGCETGGGNRATLIGLGLHVSGSEGVDGAELLLLLLLVGGIGAVAVFE